MNFVREPFINPENFRKNFQTIGNDGRPYIVTRKNAVSKWKIATDQTEEEFKEDLVYWLNVFKDMINRKGLKGKQSFVPIIISILKHLFIYTPNLYKSEITEIYAIVLFLKSVVIHGFDLELINFKYDLGPDLPRHIKSIKTKDFSEDDGFLDFVLTKNLIKIRPGDYYKYFDCSDLDHFLELTWTGMIMFENGNALENIIPQLFAIIFPNSFIETPNISMNINSDLFKTIRGPNYSLEVAFMIFILIKTGYVNEESLIGN